MTSTANIWRQPTMLRPAGRYFRLFLSHTSAHKHEVRLLSSALSAHGIAGFVAHEAIQPLQEWQNVIAQALLDCEALAAYLTSDFHSSIWTDQEVGAALGRQLLVLPLKVEIDPYGFIGRYQAMNAPAGSDPHALAAEIAAILRTHPLTKAAMAEAVVDRFVRSTGWNDARDNLNRLRRVPRDAWTSDLVASVKQAVADNEEIKGADVRVGGANAATVADEALKLVSTLP